MMMMTELCGGCSAMWKNPCRRLLVCVFSVSVFIFLFGISTYCASHIFSLNSNSNRDGHTFITNGSKIGYSWEADRVVTVESECHQCRIELELCDLFSCFCLLHQSWTRCYIKIEAIKCFPCYMKVTFHKTATSDNGLVLRINIPGLEIYPVSWTTTLSALTAFIHNFCEFPSDKKHRWTITVHSWEKPRIISCITVRLKPITLSYRTHIYFTLTVVYLHKGVLCHPSLNPTFYFCLPVANIKVWCLKAASTMTMAMTDRSRLNDFSFILKCVKFNSFRNNFTCNPMFYRLSHSTNSCSCHFSEFSYQQTVWNFYFIISFDVGVWMTMCTLIHYYISVEATTSVYIFRVNNNLLLKVVLNIYDKKKKISSVLKIHQFSDLPFFAPLSRWVREEDVNCRQSSDREAIKCLPVRQLLSSSIAWHERREKKESPK